MLVEELERLKANFLESNAALVGAVEQTSYENCQSIQNKLLLATLRLKAMEHYHQLISYIMKYPKPKTDKLTESTLRNAWISN